MSETPRTRLSPDKRRQQILAAAGELYRSRRYDDVSMEELAAKAGVARGLLHHYFGSKRDLFLAVMTESTRLPVEPLPDLAGKSIEERAKLTISWILDGAFTYGQNWVNSAGAEDLDGERDLQELMDRSDDRVARFTLDALGLPDEPALRAYVRPLVAYVKALCREWLERGSLTREEVLELSTEAVLRSVRER